MDNTFLQCYDSLAKQGLDHRELGARALQKSASTLKRCMRDWRTSGGKGDLSELMDALQRNQQLWTILQVECISRESSMDPSLRKSLLGLSQFVDKTTFQCIAEPNLNKLESLVRINENLVEGLTAEADSPRVQALPMQTAALSMSF